MPLREILSLYAALRASNAEKDVALSHAKKEINQIYEQLEKERKLRYGEEVRNAQLRRRTLDIMKKIFEEQKAGYEKKINALSEEVIEARKRYESICEEMSAKDSERSKKELDRNAQLEKCKAVLGDALAELSQSRCQLRRLKLSLVEEQRMRREENIAHKKRSDELSAEIARLVDNEFRLGNALSLEKKSHEEEKRKMSDAYEKLKSEQSLMREVHLDEVRVKDELIEQLEHEAKERKESYDEELRKNDSALSALKKELNRVKSQLYITKERLSSKSNENAALAEVIRKKEEEFAIRESKLRSSEEKLAADRAEVERLKVEYGDAAKLDMQKRELARISESQWNKELELSALEKLLNDRKADLDVREQAIVEGDLRKAESVRKGELERRQAKTGTERLDDLMFGGLPYGTNAMLVGPPFVGKETMLYAFVCEGIKKGVPAIIITTDVSPSEVRVEAKSVLGTFEDYERLGFVRYIDTYSKSKGLEHDDPYAVYVENPSDHAEILKALDAVTAQLKEKCETYRMAVISLSTLVTYSDAAQTYRLLQTIAGRNKRSHAVAMFLANKGMHSDTELQMLGNSMDGAIEFKLEGTRTFLSIQGICDVQSRAWVQYSYSKSAVNIGSFALDKIR